MASFSKDDTAKAAFGPNEYFRSVRGQGFESYTLSAASVPTEVIDGVSQKIMQRGTALAKITSGAEIGKVGPVQTGATILDGRQTAANIVGLCDTFLPWTLLHRDVEVGVCVRGTVVQAWCFELNEAGARVPLSNASAAAMTAQKRLNLNFA